MWIRVKSTGQEVNMPEFQAQSFIDNDEAVAIKTPRSKEPPFVPRPAPTLRMVPLDKEVTQMVQSLGLANQTDSYKFVKRFLDLEERVQRLERPRAAIARR